MISRGRTGTLVLLMVVMACDGGAQEKPTSAAGETTPSVPPPATAEATPSASPPATAEPASSFAEVYGSIVDIIPAADVDEEGQPDSPGFTFSAETPQITIVVQTGEVADSPVDITWFQVVDDGEHELFTHSVEVTSFQTAYSVGTNPGMLAAGTYRVEAAVAGESLSTRFEVRALATQAQGLLATAPDPVEGATPGPPDSGDSGAVGPAIDPDTVFSADTFLAAWLSQEPVDPGVHDIVLEVNAGLQGGGGSVEAYVEMGGSARSLNIPTNSSGLVVTYLRFDPCAHPGGSDLPGASARFTTNLFDDGSDVPVVDTVTNNTELGDDQAAPEIDLNAPPPNARQVSPGDEIEFDAIAQESRDGPTWQTGVKSFRLVANPGGLIGDEQTSDSGSAQPCAEKQWDLRSLATYTVPADAPPLIEICGIAADFSENERSTCIDLYTGEVWDGTVKSVVTTDGPGGPCGTSIAIEGTARFVVAVDGTVTGTYDVTGCGVSEPHAEFTGTATDAQFLFPDLIVFANGEPIPKLSPTHAQGTFTNQQGPATTWVTTWDMVCSSCP